MSLLGLFNSISPKDRRSRRLASDVSYGTEARQQLDVYGPRGDGASRPVVMFCYGGSWDSGDRREYEFVGRALAVLGYVTVIADHRLVPAVEYPVFLRDLEMATEWLVQHAAEFGGDPGNIALIGHSAGAYNAMMLVLDRQYLATSGLLDQVKAVIGISGPYDFYPFDIDISRRVFGAVADGPATQPVNLVTGVAPPTLLIHGLDDRMVLPRNSTALAARLRAVGGTVEERYYEGITHALPMLALGRILRSRVPVLAEIGAFLASCFAGQAATSQKRGLVPDTEVRGGDQTPSSQVPTTY